MSNAKPTKKLSPAQEKAEAEKLSQRSARLQLFCAGFMSGVGFGRSPKYDPADPEVLLKSMEACDQMFEVMENDNMPVHNGKDQILSIARILGLSDNDEK